MLSELRSLFLIYSWIVFILKYSRLVVFRWIIVKVYTFSIKMLIFNRVFKNILLRYILIYISIWILYVFRKNFTLTLIFIFIYKYILVRFNIFISFYCSSFLTMIILNITYWFLFPLHHVTTRISFIRIFITLSH